MNNKYFFPIQSTSLAHYFSSALIKPARYFNNKPYDIQDRYKDFLLFTNKFGTSETDCCLEIVLTDNEAKELINVNGGWYLFDVNPLPITRIRKIFFSNKEKKDLAITNIRMSTAYVPESLIEIRPFDNNPTDSIHYPSECVVIDKKNNIEKYDRYLGALALMKTAREPYMNYSQNYIVTLSFFNSIIREQVGKANNSKDFNENYQGIFDNSKGFEKVLPYLNKPIDEQILYEIAEKHKQEIKQDKITRIIDIDSITDLWTYTIAILNTYGVGEEARRKRIDGLIQSRFSALKKEKAEGVALCYGYNRGYSAFTKDYGIEKKVPFKYKLESQLDYYTIESVYQYVFNGIVSANFQYLDNWCPKLPTKQQKNKTDYVILDELIVGKKKAKVFSDEWWSGLAPRFSKDFSTLAKPIFLFFQSIIKETIEDLNNEQNEMIIGFQNELNESRKQALYFKEMLAQKTKENEELQMRLNRASNHTFVNYETKEMTPQIIASEPQMEYNPGIGNDDLKLKKREELIEIAKKHGIRVPHKAKKDELIKLLLNLKLKDNDLFSQSSN